MDMGRKRRSVSNRVESRAGIERRGTIRKREPREDRIRSLQRTLGNKAVQTLVESERLQRKPAVSSPGDRSEREADRVSDEVTKLSESDVPVTVTEQVSTSASRHVPKSVAPELRSAPGGRPLPESVRTFFEPRFGADFSGVRIHDDEKAADLNRKLDAVAFTFGRDVFFGAGRYRPDAPSGRTLLAHELTHVLQQNGGHHVHQSSDVNPTTARENALPASKATGVPVVQRTPDGPEYDIEIGGILIDDTRWKEDWPDPWDENFWSSMATTLDDLAERWTNEVYDDAIEGLETSLQATDEGGGWSGTLFTTITTAFGLLEGPAKYVTAAIQVTKAVIEQLARADEPVAGLDQFVNRLRDTDTDVHNKLRNEYRELLAEERANEPSDGSEAYRRRVRNEVVQDAISLPRRRQIMQPFVLSWIQEASSDTLDWLEDWGGVNSGHINVSYNYWHEIGQWGFDGAPFIDDVARPTGTIKALKAAFDEDLPLHHLPFQINIDITEMILTGTMRGSLRGQRTRIIKYRDPSLRIRRQHKWGLISGSESMFWRWIRKPDHPTIGDLTTD